MIRCARPLPVPTDHASTTSAPTRDPGQARAAPAPANVRTTVVKPSRTVNFTTVTRTLSFIRHESAVDGVAYTRRMPRDATGSKVVDEDWYGRSLETCEFTQVAFVDIDMTELTSKGTIFTKCSFRGVRFNASRHASSAFLNCSFHRCTFFDAAFVDCKAVGSTFERCDLSTLSVVGGDWSFTDLSGADLSRATFDGTRMREAGLAGVKAAGASLRNVDLSAAVTDGADFTGADLRGSDLSAINPLNVTLRRAVITADQAVQVAEALGLDVRPDPL